MKRGGLVVVAILLLFVSGLFASEARLGGLAGGGWYILDESNVFFNPAWVGFDAYRGSVLAELGTYNGVTDPTGQYGYVNFGVGDMLTFGLAFNRDEGEVGSIIAGSGLPAPRNGLDLMGGLNIGNLNLGLGLYKSGAKDYTKNLDADTTVSESTEKTGVLGIHLGTVLNFGEKNILDAGFHLRFNSYKDEDVASGTTETEEIDGGMAIDLGIRSFYYINDDIALVPKVGFYTFSYKDKYTNSSNSSLNVTSGDWSKMTLFAGAGANYAFGDEGLVFGGVEFDMDKITDEMDSTDGTVKEEDTWMLFPVFTGGVEAPISDRFTARAGFKKTMGSHKSIDDFTGDTGSETTFTVSETDFIALGLGVKLLDFDIDMTMGENLLYNGTYFLSGNPSNLFGKMSVTYDF